MRIATLFHPLAPQHHSPHSTLVHPLTRPRYIDPSYMIRSVSTTSNDRIYCKVLAHNAVHAAFAGYTGITVGLVNTHYVYLPIPVIIQAPRKVRRVSRHEEITNACVLGMV